MPKKPKHKKSAEARRTFGHGRKPPHPHQGGGLPPLEGGDNMPGQTEFSGPQEAEQRAGMREARGAPPTDGGDTQAPATSGAGMAQGQDDDDVAFG